MMAVWVAEDSRVLRDALKQFSLDLCVVNNNELVVIGGPKTKLGEAEDWCLPLTTKEEIKKELVDHLTQTVRWRETINYLKEQGIEKTLEFGESGVVTKINKKLLGGVAAAVTIAGFAAVIFWRHRYSQSSK